jgi:glucose-1-phosphate thymidylyltransferase
LQIILPQETLLQAANFIKTIEESQSLKIAYMGEIAYRMGHIDANNFEKMARPLMNKKCAEYLIYILQV